MANYSFQALGLDDLVVSGPDPFDSNASRNSDSYGQTTLSIAPGASWTTLVIVDNEATLEDGDGSQDLAQPATFNGRSWLTGTEVETEYSYLVRPLGATDPAEYITIYVLEFEGDVQGIAADGRLSENVTYEIISGGSDGPSVLYSDLVVCFTPGAAIATPSGPVPVEGLRPGDQVCTVDNGPQPLAWVGRQLARGTGPHMPVAVAPGVLGNARELVLSPQHRVIAPMALGLGRDVLVSAKALVGQPGVIRLPRRRVAYLHLMFDAHQVILAEGAPVESFLPGAQALRSLSTPARRRVLSLFPELRRVGWSGARAILKTGQVRRRLALGTADLEAQP